MVLEAARRRVEIGEPAGIRASGLIIAPPRPAQSAHFASLTLVERARLKIGLSPGLGMCWPADESTIPAPIASETMNLLSNLVNLNMSKRIREPIQVYLTEEERTELDRLAAAMGISRSAALRRGVAALAPTTLATGPLADLADEGLATPARLEGGEPPACRPVAPLGDLLAELRADRDDR